MAPLRGRAARNAQGEEVGQIPSGFFFNQALAAEAAVKGAYAVDEQICVS
jgi:hypothetical protein